MSDSPIDAVVQTFQKWLYLPKPEALLAVLGTVAANRLPGDPVWLMVVGPPGGGKSEILQSLNGLADIRGVGTITERALLSGTAKKEVDKESKGGLLREIGAFGIIVCKDFGSLLSMQRDERQKTMAALREIYDGSWVRDVGVDGGRKLYWQGKVGMIAGVTPTIDQHHAVMGAMGERFVMLRLPKADPMRQADKALDHAGHEDEMREELRDAVATFFKYQDGGHPKPLAQDERDRLKSLVTLVVRCRSAVERDSHHREIDLIPEPEAPTRLIVALSRLLLGLRAMGIGRQESWDIVTGVALDSMPQLRRLVTEILFLKAGDSLETGEIAEAVRYPTKTAHRALEDLTAHYVVERERMGQGRSDEWRLSVWAHKRLETAKCNFRDQPTREVGHPEESPAPVSLSTHTPVPTYSTGELDLASTLPAEASTNGSHADFEGEEPPE